MSERKREMVSELSMQLTRLTVPLNANDLSAPPTTTTNDRLRKMFIEMDGETVHGFCMMVLSEIEREESMALPGRPVDPRWRIQFGILAAEHSLELQLSVAFLHIYRSPAALLAVYEKWIRPSDTEYQTIFWENLEWAFVRFIRWLNPAGERSASITDRAIHKLSELGFYVRSNYVKALLPLHGPYQTQYQ